MIKNVMKLFLVAALISAVSCKEKDQSTEIKLDENNMVTAQDYGVGEPVQAKVKLKSEDYPKIEFEITEFDFGTINEGDKVEHVFKFKNTGKTDLVVLNAQASCGCTVPDWTKTPIKSGESGQVKIVFNSTGKPGPQQKTITLSSNTEAGNEIIKFKANVTPKAK
ncbi:DUF1573 domain-containing protein [Flavobacterium sp.]|uniref:DUF1573 domain-containing protein n=1 Tax=Flavobacterium sp. TaxID=239 RepID=UPI003D6C52D0